VGESIDAVKLAGCRVATMIQSLSPLTQTSSVTTITTAIQSLSSGVPPQLYAHNGWVPFLLSDYVLLC